MGNKSNVNVDSNPLYLGTEFDVSLNVNVENLIVVTSNQEN